MNTNKKESKLKEFRRIQARISELHTLIVNVPPVPLKNKIFVGHWRFFKVRDDVLRSSIGEQVKLVVDACNHWVLGKKKEPKSYERCCYSTIYVGGIYGSTVVSHQWLNPISQEEMDKINVPNKPTFIRKWFHVEKRYKSYGSKNVAWFRYYPNIPPHMVEFAYKAAYVKEKAVKAGNYETELTELTTYMDVNNGWNYLYSNYRDEWDLSTDKKRELLKLKKKEISDYYSEA